MSGHGRAPDGVCWRGRWAGVPQFFLTIEGGEDATRSRPNSYNAR